KDKGAGREGVPAESNQSQAARPRLSTAELVTTRRRRARSYFADFFAFFVCLHVCISTFLAVIVYVIVTLSPAFTSVLSSPRAISQFSLPFLTVIESGEDDTTGPVTW